MSRDLFTCKPVSINPITTTTPFPSPHRPPPPRLLPQVKTRNDVARTATRRHHDAWSHPRLTTRQRIDVRGQGRRKGRRQGVQGAPAFFILYIYITYLPNHTHSSPSTRTRKIRDTARVFRVLQLPSLPLHPNTKTRGQDTTTRRREARWDESASATMTRVGMGTSCPSPEKVRFFWLKYTMFILTPSLPSLAVPCGVPSSRTPEHEKHAPHRVFFVFYGFTSPPLRPNTKIMPMSARFACSGTSLSQTRRTRQPQCRVLRVWGVPPPFPPPSTTQTRRTRPQVAFFVSGMFPTPQT